MLERKAGSPRAPGDYRMNLYHDTFRGRLRWYVKLSKTGRRVEIAEEYSADERSDSTGRGRSRSVPWEECHGCAAASPTRCPLPRAAI